MSLNITAVTFGSNHPFPNQHERRVESDNIMDAMDAARDLINDLVNTGTDIASIGLTITPPLDTDADHGHDHAGHEDM